MAVLIVNPKDTEFKLIYLCRDFLAVALFSCIHPSTWGFQPSPRLLRLPREIPQTPWEKPLGFLQARHPHPSERRELEESLSCGAPNAAWTERSCAGISPPLQTFCCCCCCSSKSTAWGSSWERSVLSESPAPSNGLEVFYRGIRGCWSRVH